MAGDRSKAELDREIDRALARGRRRAVTEPQAERAHYERRTGRVVVDLTNGCSFVFPARSLQGLAQATDAELAEIEILGAGHGLHWPALDADFTVPGLLLCTASNGTTGVPEPAPAETRAETTDPAGGVSPTGRARTTTTPLALAGAMATTTPDMTRDPATVLSSLSPTFRIAAAAGGASNTSSTRPGSATAATCKASSCNT